MEKKREKENHIMLSYMVNNQINLRNVSSIYICHSKRGKLFKPLKNLKTF